MPANNKLQEALRIESQKMQQIMAKEKEDQNKLHMDTVEAMQRPLIALEGRTPRVKRRFWHLRYQCQYARTAKPRTMDCGRARNVDSSRRTWMTQYDDYEEFDQIFWSNRKLITTELFDPRRAIFFGLTDGLHHCVKADAYWSHCTARQYCHCDCATHSKKPREPSPFLHCMVLLMVPIVVKLLGCLVHIRVVIGCRRLKLL